jgi:cell division septation protein DedD
MTDLQRLKEARMGVNLGPLGAEVPRGRALAYAVSAGALLVTGFAAGYATSGWIRPSGAGGVPSFSDAVPGRDLVALLAEVERVDRTTTSDEMRYPELLQKGVPIEVPAAPPPMPETRAELLPSTAQVDVQVDPAPPGEFTVELGSFTAEEDARALREHLKGREQPVWSRVERVGGVPAWIVSVGGYASEAEAKAAIPAIAAATAGTRVAGISAKAAPIAKPPR